MTKKLRDVLALLAVGFVVWTVLLLLWEDTKAAGPQTQLEYISELSIALQQLSEGTATWEGYPDGSILRYTDTDSTARVMLVGNLDLRRLDLAWEAPAQNTDGTPVTDLAGFIFLSIGFQMLPTDALAGDTVHHSIWWPSSMDFTGRVAAYDTNDNFSVWSNSLDIPKEDGQ